MNNHKYVGLDTDQATIIARVEDAKGNFIMEAAIETSASSIRQFFKGLEGTIHVAFEEGTQAAWFYDVIRPLVADVTVCDGRWNKLIQSGNKGDRIDAAKLTRLLRLGELHAVYHGERSTRGLKELVHGYESLVTDTTRAKNRLKAVFRSQAIRCRGVLVYSPQARKQWLEKLGAAAINARASILYEQYDCLTKLRDKAHKAMTTEARTHPAYKRIKKVSGLGEVRTAQLIAVVGSPHRFRTKRQFWPYCGLAVVTRDSSEYEIVDGQRRRKRNKKGQTRGLNQNYNRTLKAVFKGAAATAIERPPFKQYRQRLIDKGIRPELALLTVARKIAAITLTIWKKGEEFDPERVNQAVPGTGNK
jgi:transposase